MAREVAFGLPSSTPVMSLEETQYIIEQKTADLPFTWDEVKGTEGYQSVDRETQANAKRDYFETYIAPRGVSWQKFEEQTDPSISERFIGGAQAAIGNIQESVALGAEQIGFTDAAKSLRATAGIHQKAAAETAVVLPYGDEGLEQFKNLGTSEFWTQMFTEALPQTLPIIAAGVGGAYVGAKTGAITGAAVGTAVAPGPGTVAGAAVGTAAGAMFGAMVGVAGASFAQSVGPAYRFFLERNPGDEDGAVDYALKQAGLTSAFEAASVPLGIVGYSLGPVKHAFVQLAIQSMHGGSSAVLQNYIAQEVDPTIPLTRGIVQEAVAEGLFESVPITIAVRKAYKATKAAKAGKGPPEGPQFFNEQELGFPNEANPELALPPAAPRLGLPAPAGEVIEQPATQTELYQRLEAPAGTPPYGAVPTPAPHPTREATALELGPAHPTIQQLGPAPAVEPEAGPPPPPGAPESYTSLSQMRRAQGERRQRSEERAQEPSIEVQAEEVEIPPVDSELDIEANEAATSPINDISEPTQAQKEAGNYKKGHVNFQGLEVTIENPAGSVRSGVGADGKAWETPMVHHYGYVKRTAGADGEQVDVFIGPEEQSVRVFVVDQVDPANGKFDEHKAMLGFESEDAAAEGYLANYEPGWKGLGAISGMDMAAFKGWLETADTTKPVALPAGAAPESAQEAAEAPETEIEPPAPPMPQIQGLGESLGGKSVLAATGKQPIKPATHPETGPFPPRKEGGRPIIDGQVETTTGRKIPAPPEIRLDSNRKATTDLKKQREWLKEQAIKEAQTQGNDFAERQFRQVNVNNFSQADGDLLNDFLFGETYPEFEKEIPDETQQVGEDGPETLEKQPSEPIRGAGEERGAEQGAPRGRGEDVAPTGEGGEAVGGEGISAAPGRDDGGGASVVGAGAAPERGGVARPAGGVGETGSAQPGRNYSITDSDALGEGGAVQKFEENVAAIKLLKKLEDEGRPATREEQATLVKYVGWGGITESFVTYGAEGNWLKRATQLRDLLTTEEYNEARASSINAHYTAKNVVDFMYGALLKMGFGSGQVLDPSTGTGHFMGMMPAGMSINSKFTAIERDSLTARIATKIYPDAEIRQMEYQDARLPNGFFDLAISNVPFADAKFRYGKKGKFRLHNYFFMKSLDKVRPGGLIAFITSAGTMDAQGNAFVRNLISQQADLVTAFRLPLQAFKKNALTEVTTDIIFLRKRDPAAAPRVAAPKWNVSKEWRGRFSVNEYYHENPDHIFGRLTEDKLHKTRSGVSLREGETLDQHMAKALETVPAGIFARRQAQIKTEAPKLTILAPEDTKELSYVVEGKKIMQREGGMLREVADVKGTTGKRMAGMIGIRGALRAVLQTQVEEHGDAQIAGAQTVLRARYDEFVKQHGPVSAQANRLAFREDPEYPLLQALEVYDADKKTAEKSDIFTKRTIERAKSVLSVETAGEALLVSLNEMGDINLTHMENITGRSREELLEELKGVIYQNAPNNYVTADEYLSGNVRQKLTDAKEAAAIDPVYKENVEVLETVQPEDLPPSQISARLGAAWIPTDVVKTFAKEVLEVSADVKHSNLTALWSVSSFGYSVANTQRWGTDHFTGHALMEKALNLTQPTVYHPKDAEGNRPVNTQATAIAREKQEQIKEKFKEWVWSNDERAERLSRFYNDNYNNLRDRTWDGSHLTLPGTNPIVFAKLHAHQKNAIWRGVQTKGNLLLAHAVGAGKTWEMAGIAMERRRLGLSKKPLFVIPNSLIESGQFAREFLVMYPNAKILTGTPKDFEAKKRKRMIARITTGDWDAVIIAHSSFGKIPVSYAMERAYIDDQLAIVEAAIKEMGRADGRSEKKMVKELEAMKERMKARLQEMAATIQKDDVVTFEELGVDHISVDEAHNFKNLFIATKMGRMPGIKSGGKDTAKTQDMYMKVRYVQGLNNGGGIVFSTATPISNSMAEMFTLSRYLDPQGLRDQGLEHFDSWAGTYGEPVTAMELNPTGTGFRLHTRFARFVNLPELTGRMRTFADVQTSAMLNLPTPAIKTGKPIVIAIPPSEALKEYVQELGRRADALRGKPPGPGDNMLVVTGDGRHAALDLRTVLGPEHGPEPESKLPVTADKIVSIWEETKADSLTQLVFLDISTPAQAESRGFSGYFELRRLLLERGIPGEEIAIVHDFKEKRREVLYGKVRKGEVRVVIGSTGKMGEGTNVQDKLIALHHVDIPWTPAGIEQRNGRIVRQGNSNAEVEIYNYVTEGSFDAYFWQTQETKAKFIAQVLTGNIDVRFAEDVDGVALNAAEAKAIATGNPLVKEKAEVDAEVEKLAIQRRGFYDNQFASKRQLKAAQGAKAAEEARMPKVRADAAAILPTKGDDFKIVIKGQEYADRAEANKAFMKAVEESWVSEGAVQIGNFAGFGLYVRPAGSITRLIGQTNYTLFRYHTEIKDPMQVLQNLVDRIEPEVAQLERENTRLDKDIAEMEELIVGTFPKEEEYNALVARQEALYKELDLDKKGEELGEGELEEAKEGEREEDEEAPAARSVKIPNIGHENTVVTREEAQQLQDELAVDMETKRRAGIDPETMFKTGKLATFYIEAGVRRFADFSRYMLDALGKGIKRYLGGAFLRGKRLLGRAARRRGPRKPLPPRGLAPKGRRPGTTKLVDKVLSKAFPQLWTTIFDRVETGVAAWVPERVKAGIVDRYGQTPEMAEGHQQYQGRIRRDMRGIRQISEKLFLNPQESTVVYEWLQEKPNKAREQELFFQLPAESVELLQSIKALIRELGKEEVRLGQLSQESFERNENAYLHRTYRVHELNEKGEITNQRKRGIKVLGDQLKGRGRSQQYPMRRLMGDASKEWIADRFSKDSKPLFGSKFLRFNAIDKLGRLRKMAYVQDGFPIPAKFTAPGSNWQLDQDSETAATNYWEARWLQKNGTPIMWRDLTKSERQMRGEILDAKYAVVRTLLNMMRDVEVGRYFEWINDHRDKKGAPDWALESDADLPAGAVVAGEAAANRAYKPNEWVHVPTTPIPKTGGAKKFGALAGKYVPGPLWNDVRHVVEFDTSILPEWWKTLLRAFKISKTALSPTVHVNNTMANVVLADWEDLSHRNLLRSLNTFVKFWRGDEQAKAVLERFEDAGASFGTYAQAELRREVLDPMEAQLREELKEAETDQDTGNVFKLAKALALVEPIWGAAAWAKEKAIDIYQFEDNFFRLAMFLQALEEGATDTEAGRRATEAFLNYDINAPWVNAARHTGLPFLSFTYRALPKLKNIIKEKPWKLAKLALLAGALNALAYAVTGEDEEQERAFMPRYREGKVFGLFPRLIRMPWSWNGDPIFLDITRWIPLGDLLLFEDSSAAVPIPPFMMVSGPLQWGAELMLNKNAFTREEIYKETATVAEGAQAVALHLWRGLSPNIVLWPRSYAWDKVGLPGSSRPQKDPFGREYPLVLGIMNSFGLKLATYPLNNLQRAYMLNAERKLAMLEGEKRRLTTLYFKAGISKGDWEKSILKFNERQKTIIDDVNERSKRFAGGNTTLPAATNQ